MGCPAVVITGFGASAIELQLSVWATRENILELRTSMHERIKAAFDRHGIEIPYPVRTPCRGRAPGQIATAKPT